MTTYNIINASSMASGQPEDVSVILANFQAIAAIINGQLDNNNLHPNANIPASKIQGYPSDAGKSLLGDGSWGVSAPTGAVMAFAGMTPPGGWLICDGSAISRTTYPTLFALIAGTYGAGDGSTTFNIPDLRGRAIYGIGGGGGAGTLGANEGQADPVYRGPAHPHSYSDPGHAHAGRRILGPDGQSGFYAGFGAGIDDFPTTYAGIGISIGSTGYSTPNSPSHMGLNYIIKT